MLYKKQRLVFIFSLIGLCTYAEGFIGKLATSVCTGIAVGYAIPFIVLRTQLEQMSHIDSITFQGNISANIAERDSLMWKLFVIGFSCFGAGTGTMYKFLTYLETQEKDKTEETPPHNSDDKVNEEDVSQG